MFDLRKFVEVGRWFSPFPGPPGPLYLVLGLFFVVLVVGSILLYVFRARIFAQKPVLKGMVTRFGWYPFWIGVTGLLLLAARYGQVPYFDMRILLYLTVLAALGFIGFIVYYLRARYPRRVAEWRAFELRRKYAPEPRRKRRSG